MKIETCMDILSYILEYIKLKSDKIDNNDKIKYIEVLLRDPQILLNYIDDLEIENQNYLQSPSLYFMNNEEDIKELNEYIHQLNPLNDNDKRFLNRIR